MDRLQDGNARLTLFRHRVHLRQREDLQLKGRCLRLRGFELLPAAGGQRHRRPLLVGGEKQARALHTAVDDVCA
jgi:hypothetical protein